MRTSLKLRIKVIISELSIRVPVAASIKATSFYLSDSPMANKRAPASCNLLLRVPV
jgi:hypothetical protein